MGSNVNDMERTFLSCHFLSPRAISSLKANPDFHPFSAQGVTGKKETSLKLGLSFRVDFWATSHNKKLTWLSLWNKTQLREIEREKKREKREDPSSNLGTALEEELVLSHSQDMAGVVLFVGYPCHLVVLFIQEFFFFLDKRVVGRWS